MFKRIGSPTIYAMTLLFLVLSEPNFASELPMQQPQRRQPIAIVQADDWLFVANRLSGSVSVIELTSRRVVREFRIGKRLSALKTVPAGHWLVALDDEQHELILLSRDKSDLKVVQRLTVPDYPVSLDVDDKAAQATICSLWSRQISVVDLTPLDRTGDPDAGRLSIRATVSVPFAPLMQQLLRAGSRLVVADAFAGQIAVLDVHEPRVLSVRKFPGHNIRGLAVSRDRSELLLAHQLLRSHEPTTADNVRWGIVQANLIRGISLNELLTKDGDGVSTADEVTPVAGAMYPLGKPEAGTGDPHSILVTPRGRVVVSLSGVAQVAVGTDPSRSLALCDVGRHPTALLVDDDERYAYVANTFDDSLSVIELAEPKVVDEIVLGPRPPMSDVERGEQLFFDARLSRDGWFSCHSCHSNGHSNGELNDNRGDDSFGAPKRVLSLLGVADTKPWAWNGSQSDLGEQIRKSLRNTMHTPQPNAIESDARALEAYLRTLQPAPSVSEARHSRPSDTVRRGQLFFERLECVNCHRPPTFTSQKAFDVGLHDEVGNRLFNPPSLRGVSQRAAFFHDNRVQRLEEVFERARHGLTTPPTAAELEDLLSYLRSL